MAKNDYQIGKEKGQSTCPKLVHKDGGETHVTYRYYIMMVRDGNLVPLGILNSNIALHINFSDICE